MDLAFQKVQEFLLPGLSALCTLSVKLVSSIQSGDTPNTRETLTVIMDSIALLCNTHHKLNMKRRELIKPELNPPYTRLCNEEIKTTSKLFGDDLSKHLRGCLYKNHPLNFAPKIILPETLATERLYKG